MNYVIAIAAACALSVISSSVQAKQDVFLENDYGASIYYKTSTSSVAKILQDKQRASLGEIDNVQELLIAGSSYIFSDFYSLHNIIQNMGFVASQHLDSDAVIRINPSSFYQQWNVVIDWEKHNTSLVAYDDAFREVIDEIMRSKSGPAVLIKLLEFVKEPYYKQGKGEKAVIARPFTRKNDPSIKKAIAMIKASYDLQSLDEVQRLVVNKIPFYLTYNDEVILKQKVLDFINKEIKRLKNLGKG